MTDIAIHPEPRMEARQAPQGNGWAPGQTRQKLDVSIVMPCLNEEEAIRECVNEAQQALARLGLSGEVLVVDNGSSDRSAHVAMSAGARVVHEPSRGYGNACRRGLSEARGRYVVMGDADGTYDFSALPQFVLPLMDGADIVMGNRLNDNMEKGAMPWLHRYVGNPFLTRTMNLLYGSRIDDAHCGLRSIKKASLVHLDLTAPGMEFASEFLIAAMWRQLCIEQCLISYRRRHGGRPKLRTFRDGMRHLRLMLAMAGQRHSRRLAHARAEHVPLVPVNGEPRRVGEA